MIGILLYLFFIFSSNSEHYLRRKDVLFFKKFANVFFSFILFYFFYHELKAYFVEFTSLNFLPDRIQNTFLYYNKYYVFASYYLYFFTTLYMFLVSINLAQGKEKGRKQLFRSAFIVTPIVCNNFILVWYHLFGLSTEKYLPLILIVVFVLLFFLIFFLFYKLKWINQIFDQNNIDIKIDSTSNEIS